MFFYLFFILPVLQCQPVRLAHRGLLSSFRYFCFCVKLKDTTIYHFLALVSSSFSYFFFFFFSRLFFFNSFYFIYYFYPTTAITPFVLRFSYIFNISSWDYYFNPRLPITDYFLLLFYYFFSSLLYLIFFSQLDIRTVLSGTLKQIYIRFVS